MDGQNIFENYNATTEKLKKFFEDEEKYLKTISVPVEKELKIKNQRHPSSNKIRLKRILAKNSKITNFLKHIIIRHKTNTNKTTLEE